MEKKLLPKNQSQLSCSHYIQCDLRLSAAKHKITTHAATAARNLDAAIPLRSAKTELQNTKETSTTATQIAATCSSKNRISTPKRKNEEFEGLFKGIWRILKRNSKRKIISAKEKNLLPKHHLQLSCSHYNTIYDSQLQNTKLLRLQPQQRGTLTQPFLYSTLPDSSRLYSSKLCSTLPVPLPLPSLLPLLYLYFTSTQVPTGHNDLWASENVKVCNSEFPPWNFLWSHIIMHYVF